MTDEVRHRPVFTDRGPSWSHRYEARCVCGVWRGIPVRSEKKAQRQYREHVRSEAKHAARARRRSGRPTPGALTSTEDLPDLLR